MWLAGIFRCRMASRRVVARIFENDQTGIPPMAIPLTPEEHARLAFQRLAELVHEEATENGKGD